MRSMIRMLLVTSIGVLVCGCGDSQGPITELPRELSVAESKLVDADNRFYEAYAPLAEARCPAVR